MKTPMLMHLGPNNLSLICFTQLYLSHYHLFFICACVFVQLILSSTDFLLHFHQNANEDANAITSGKYNKSLIFTKYVLTAEV